MRDVVLKALQAVALCTVILAAGTVVVYLPRVGLPVAPDAAQAFTRAEFITIILSAVTAILSALMIMIAILAFWGYATLREEARRTAKEIASTVAKEIAGPVAAREARAFASQAPEGSRDEPESIAEAFSRDDAR